MEKKLTPEEKLYVVREAKKMYLAGKGSRFLCPLIRGCVNRGRDIDELGEDYVPAGYLHKYIPELYEYKPSHKGPGDVWWPDEVTEPRLAVLDNLEARYYAETNWWSRMWFKIRNTRIWKS